MKFTGTSMRNELKFVMEAFHVVEKFLETNDPSIVIGKSIEFIQNHLSAIQELYNEEAEDRNAIAEAVATHLEKISGFALEAAALLRNQKNPEDTNRSI